MANMPREIENATRLPAENAGIRKKASGIMALGERDSQERNATARSAPPTNAEMMTGLPHPSWLASMSAYVKENSVPVPSARPGMSSWRACSERDSRTVRVATRNATIPMGTFRKKTEAQPRCSTM